MGWSYGQAEVMLNRYPGFAGIPLLLERWPALNQAVERQGPGGTGSSTAGPPSGGTPPDASRPPGKK